MRVYIATYLKGKVHVVVRIAVVTKTPYAKTVVITTNQ